MKTQLRTLLGAMGVVTALMPLSLLAAPVLRSGESIGISGAQEVPSDFYAAGGDVTVSGKVSGDLYATAGTVTMNGEVKQDVVIGGGSIRIDGPVGDDVRVVGGEVVISGTVGGDVVVMGGVTRILSTAQIKGDLLFLSGEVDMAGDLRGSLSGRAGIVRINGPVLGSVSLHNVQTFELGDQARVEGTITYSGTTELVRAPGSVVVGDTTRDVLPEVPHLNSFGTLSLLALLFTTLAFLLLCKVKLQLLMPHTIGAYGRHGLVGLGTLVLMPIIAILFLVTIIGSPIGVMLLLSYALLLLIGSALNGIFVGAIFSRYMDGVVTISLKWSLLGALACALLLYIPIIGMLTLAIISLVNIGGIVTLFYRWIRAT